MSDTGALVARSRGLAGHLLRPEQIAQLCSVPRAQLTTQFATQLAALGAIEQGGSPLPDARALDLAIRQQAARRLRTLARWAGGNRGVISLLFDEEDMHSLRALVRATFAGVPAEQRMEGLIATPTLPVRALALLAACGDVANLASLLVTWKNAFGAALAVEAARPHPDLFRIDLALARVFAARARREAGRNSMGRHFAERIIDMGNLWTCLILGEHRADIEAVDLWVPGGALIQEDDLAYAIRTAHRELLTQRLLPRLAGTPLSVALAADPKRGAEGSVLNALANEFAMLARRDPTSLAPVIAFVLKQRVEVGTLLRIIWSMSAGMPSATIRRSVGVAA